jgi:hypothetical protein
MPIARAMRPFKEQSADYSVAWPKLLSGSFVPPPPPKPSTVFDLAVRAEEALAEALKLPPGLARGEALKKASQLRLAADKQGIEFSKRGRPAKR